MLHLDFEPNQSKRGVHVAKDGCLSSCVFLIAGSVRREIIAGPVGIHRIYSTRTGNVEYGNAQEEFQRIRSDVETYLHEMNLSSRLLDAMLSVPSEEMRILTFAELDEFGLTGDDPVYAEVENSREAKEKGVSKQEFLARKAEVSRQCDTDSDEDYFKMNSQEREKVGMKYHYCYESIMWGLSVSEYKIREARRLEICKGIKGQERRDCWNRVMREGK